MSLTLTGFCENETRLRNPHRRILQKNQTQKLLYIQQKKWNQTDHTFNTLAADVNMGKLILTSLKLKDCLF